MKLRQTVLGGILLVSALASHALSIGRVRGAAWIGQPLDVTVPVRLEAGEDASSLCFDADVFHADTRVEPRSVQILSDSTPIASGGREIAVRVRSSLIVDEPVVTVYLKVGCDQKVTRRLVLLADVPTETSSALNVVPLPVVPVPPSGIAATAPSPRGSSAPEAAAPAGAPASTTASTPAPARPVAAPRPAPRPRAPAATAAAPATPRATAPAAAAPTARAPAPAPVASAAVPRARLQLDPAEPLPDRDTGLRSSNTLSSTPQEDEARRAEAAAIWRSINAQPEDVLRETQRLQELEKSLLALRSQMMQNQTTLSDLRTQLDQAQHERYLNPVVYVLALLLLLALAGLAFFWRRGPRSTAPRSADWWRDVDHRSPVTVQVAPAGPIPGITEPPVPAPRHGSTVKTSAASASRAPSDELDLDLGFDNPESVLVQHDSHDTMVFHPAPLPRRMHTDFHSSFGGSGRSVNTEELFDIHQQADFFTSLGQHEQAIGVLMGHIRDNPETSALAYLDLFRIYHQQNRRPQFDQLRDEFHAAFNADVPEFDAFNESGPGLEGYAETLRRIQELWGSPDGITLIEELIFRRPARTGDGQAFDLEAYRELLLLFAVALEVSEGDDDADFVVSSGSAFAVIDAPNGPLTVPPSLEDELPQPREASVSLPPLPELVTPSRLPKGAGPVGASSSVGIDFVLSDSMVAPLSSLPKPVPPKQPPASVSLDNGIDFELFDPSTEAELDPKRKK